MNILQMLAHEPGEPFSVLLEHRNSGLGDEPRIEDVKLASVHIDTCSLDIRAHA